MPDLPTRSVGSLRERTLRSVLDRRAAARDRYLALQDAARRDLSPLERDLMRQAMELERNVLDHSGELVRSIRSQNEAIAADRAANPLRPAARRSYSPAAILGTLERERRHNAPLSRGAYARAQAVAASRSKYDLRQAYRRSGTDLSDDASFRGEASFYDLRGVDVSVADVSRDASPDPCVEVQRREAMRREVMFARGLAPFGYRTKKTRRVC